MVFAKMREGTRLRELDGLRGIAVLAVVMFHYFGRYTSERGQPLYPYGSLAPWTSYGAAGVDLFFIVWGFVIFLSLKSSSGIWHFAAKRADRLVAPMIVLSIVTFLTLTLLPTPFLNVTLADFLPSWTFSHPILFTWLDPDIGYIDGVYWTLFYEVRFYVLVAVLWFAVSRERAHVLLVTLSLLFTALAIALKFAGLPHQLGTLELLTMYQKLPLFAIGVVLATVYERGLSWPTLLVVAVLFASAIVGNGVAATPALTVITLAVLAVASRAELAQVFAWTPLTYVGVASYSLYLIHQNAGVAVIYRLPADLPLWAQLLGVLAIVGFMLLIARLSYKYIELRRPFTTWLRSQPPAGGAT